MATFDQSIKISSSADFITYIIRKTVKQGEQFRALRENSLLLVIRGGQGCVYYLRQHDDETTTLRVLIDSAKTITDAFEQCSTHGEAIQYLLSIKPSNEQAVAKIRELGEKHMQLLKKHSEAQPFDEPIVETPKPAPKPQPAPAMTAEAENAQATFMVGVVVVVAVILLAVGANFWERMQQEAAQQPDYRNEHLTISYESRDWVRYDPEDYWFCTEVNGLDCVFALCACPDSATWFVLGKYDLRYDVTNEEIADFAWTLMTNEFDVNRGPNALTELDGLPIIRRYFNGKAREPYTNVLYGMQNYIVRGDVAYEFFFISTTREQFEYDKPQIDDLLAGIDILPLTTQ